MKSQRHDAIILEPSTHSTQRSQTPKYLVMSASTLQSRTRQYTNNTISTRSSHYENASTGHAVGHLRERVPTAGPTYPAMTASILVTRHCRTQATCSSSTATQRCHTRDCQRCGSLQETYRPPSERTHLPASDIQIMQMTTSQHHNSAKLSTWVGL